MRYELPELPRAAWSSIVRWTVASSIISAIVSVLACALFFSAQGQDLNEAGIAAAAFIPVMLGGPMMSYQCLRHQQLKLANQKLQVLASTDWLTTCLNRRAFTNLVTSQLSQAAAGAFLVIDADHFKTINDHFGHDRGDEALQIMAQTIKANVREGDLVGRMGGEEFGVFLVAADFETSRKVAERIRLAINALVFAPEGAAHRLSVSVGGAFYDHAIAFTDLFRIADQRLYGAKQLGRNRVEVVYASDHPPVQMNQRAYG